MAEQYQEGEVLKGSDGKTYIVVGGVPREQVSAPAIEGGVYRLPTSPQKAAEEDRKAAEEARKQAAAERERIRFEQEQAAGGGAKPTEAQQKTLTLLTRIAGGASDIQKTLAADPESQQAGLFETLSRNVLGEGVVTRTVAGPERRIVTDSQADMLDALLTLGTGAAYNEEQKIANTVAYFPQYGDTKEEIAIKNERLKRLIEAARIQAGPLADKFDEVIKPLFGSAIPPATGGEAEAGPKVTVTPEESIAEFGELAYDKNGNLVGRAYSQSGAGVYYNSKGEEVGIIRGVAEEKVQEPAPSFFGGIVRDVGEAITGSERATATTEGLPDWVEMPEMQQLFSLPTFKAALGTAFGGGPQEIAQIVQSNFPGTEVFQDEKGNYILRSPSTGQRYAIKPGFQLSDVPRALSILLTGAGGRGAGVAQTALREGALQTGIETTQAATGGTFNPEDIATAAVIGGGGQKLAEVLPGVVQGVRNVRTGRAAPEMAIQGAPELPGGLVAPRAAGGRVIPEAPSQLNKPRVPTTQEMNQFSSVQEVNASDLRRGQNVYDWEANQRGEYAEPLIEGYGDLPVGVRLENGEVIVYDGNHRVALAMGEGKQNIPMRVIDARNFDPENMGRRPVQPRQEMTDEELLAELQAPPVGGRGTAGAMSVSEETIRAQRAAELPVPIELARFQRTRNFAEQQRARELAKNNEVGGPIRDRMSQQQDALRQNFERFIEGTGSQVWENPYEQGGVIADALSTLAKRERTKIKALYKRAEQAGEMREPVSYRSLSDFIAGQTPTTREKLAPVLRTVQEQLDAADPNKTGMITLNQMEDIRKLINKVASPGTPDASFGRDMRGIIDDATKDAGGDVYRQARSARAKYARDFDDIDLVQKIYSTKPGSTERYVALEKVVDRITGTSAPLDSVNSLLSLLDRAGPRGARAKKELQGAVMEKIRDQAYRGITRDESGGVVIQPAALNSIIVQLDKSGKLDAIFDKKTAELLRTVNDVTKDIVTAPPGSVNASGTSSAIMNAIDTVATFGTTGIPVPAAKILNEFRKALANRAMRKEVKRLLD